MSVQKRKGRSKKELPPPPASKVIDLIFCSTDGDSLSEKRRNAIASWKTKRDVAYSMSVTSAYLLRC